MLEQKNLGCVSITLSGADSIVVKEATQNLRKLLGTDFALVDGPVEESGSVEVGCEYRFVRLRTQPRLRLVKASRAMLSRQRAL